MKNTIVGMDRGNNILKCGDIIYKPTLKSENTCEDCNKPTNKKLLKNGLCKECLKHRCNLSK